MKNLIRSNVEVNLILPDIAYTKEGQMYCPHENMWILYDGGNEIKLNFAKYNAVCSDDLFNSFKLMMVHILRKQSLYTCSNFFGVFLKFLNFIIRRSNENRVDTITGKDVIGFRTTYRKEQESALLAIRGKLRTWVRLGYPGITAEAAETFDNMRLEKNDSGMIVRSHDAVRGPFNNEEFTAIINYLLDNYAKGVIDIVSLSLGFACMIFGARPVSFAAMRVKHFIEEKDCYGGERYFLMIPAAKRRKGGRYSHLLKRRLTPEIGLMFRSQITQIRQMLAKPIAEGLDPLDLPLFPSINGEGKYTSTSRSIYQKMVACFKSGDPIACNRNGQEGSNLRVHPRRFRYTVGTRMAEEGKREREIAEALGQVSTKSARIYVEATGKIRDNINERLSKEVRPVADYFTGKKVFSKEEDPDEFSIPVRSFHGQSKGESLGGCVKKGFCGGFVPLPCYLCRNFRPWIEAPHDEILKWLLQERERKLVETGDLRYASVNDEVIIKVDEIVRFCNANKFSRKEVK